MNISRATLQRRRFLQSGSVLGFGALSALCAGRKLLHLPRHLAAPIRREAHWDPDGHRRPKCERRERSRARHGDDGTRSDSDYVEVAACARVLCVRVTPGAEASLDPARCRPTSGDGADRLVDERRRARVRLLGDRQPVHVGAQGDHRAVAAAQDADDPGMGDAGAHFHAEVLQVLRHQPGRAELPVAELRVLVNIPAPGDHLRRHGGDAGVEVGGRCAVAEESGSQRDSGEEGGSGKGRHGRTRDWQ